MKKILSIFLIIILFSCSSTNINYNENMELKCEYNILENGNYEFVLKAKRLKLVENEYLPSSENFVVKVHNLKGNEVYNSSYMKNFFMVISDVLPKKVNEEYTYKMEWNLKDNNNKDIENGIYKVYLIIPAKPNFYTCNVEIEIKR